MTDQLKRARRWFWLLAGIAVLSSAGVTWSLGREAGALTGLVFLGSALVGVTALVQATRVLAVLQPRHAGRRRPPGRVSEGRATEG